MYIILILKIISYYQNPNIVEWVPWHGTPPISRIQTQHGFCSHTNKKKYICKALSQTNSLVILWLVILIYFTNKLESLEWKSKMYVFLYTTIYHRSEYTSSYYINIYGMYILGISFLKSSSVTLKIFINN